MGMGRPSDEHGEEAGGGDALRGIIPESPALERLQSGTDRVFETGHRGLTPVAGNEVGTPSYAAFTFTFLPLFAFLKYCV